jgi:tetratricopeptide (TPR) repeat protein
MKYLAKKILLLLIITFYAVPLQAAEINYPNANDYIYSKYEINLIKELKTSLDKLKTLNDVCEYILNYKYYFKNKKNKYYSIEIILMLLNKLSAYKVVYAPTNDGHFLLKQPKIHKFVTKYEKSQIYTDDEIWGKIIVWIFLKPIGTEKDLYFERRLNLLKQIIDNNKECAPIIAYLLIIIDEYYLKVIHHKKRSVEIIQTIIDNYPSTEFAAFSFIDIACLYGQLGQKEKAIQSLDTLFKNNPKNFFLGNSDLYSSAYAKMVKFYYKIGNNEKAAFFLNKINEKIPEIDKFINYYSQKIK